MFKGEYIPPTLTVDSVVFQLAGDSLQVLLLKRANDPFKDHWALPGGYSAAGETTTEAMQRIMLAKTSVDITKLSLVEQLYTFDTVARDPRGHAVSVVYMGLGTGVESQISDDNCKFFAIDKLPALAYDHDEIISYALGRLRSKVGYTNILYALLPPKFTLSELQRGHELILGRVLDKRNFRKKYLSLDLLQDTGEMSSGGAHRPAKLYSFSEHALKTLDDNFS